MGSSASSVGQSSDANIDLTFEDGTTMSFDADFAKDLNNSFDRLIASNDAGTSNYSNADWEYSAVKGIIDDFDDAGVSQARGTNKAGLDETSKDYSEDVAWLFNNQNKNAERGGDGDLDYIASVGRGFNQAYDDAIGVEPDEPAGTGTGGGDDTPTATDDKPVGQAPSDEVVGDVRELLADSRDSDNSSEKSSLLSDAIDALIDSILGGAAGGTGTGGGEGSELSDKIDDIAESIGDDKTEGAEDNISGKTGEASAADQVESSWGGGDFEFDTTGLLDLLGGLQDVLSLIDSSTELTEEQKEELLEKVEGIVDSIVTALDEGGEGGESITRDELVDIVNEVEDLNVGIEENVADGSGKNNALDGLGDGLEGIFAELDNGSQQQEEPESAIA